MEVKKRNYQKIIRNLIYYFFHNKATVSSSNLYNNKYKLIERIANGAYATVFKVEDVLNNKMCLLYSYYFDNSFVILINFIIDIKDWH